MCWTLNNYSETEMADLIVDFEKIGAKYIIGKEVGEKCGTPHLQGYTEFTKEIRLSGLKKINSRVHWTKCKGDRKSNVEYCSKDGDVVSTLPVPMNLRLLKKYENVVWNDWQTEVINIVEAEPDERSIHWFYETVGNTGKSFLAKYLFLKYGCIIADGKKDNVFNQVLTWCAGHMDESPRIILLDVPRANNDYVQYGVLEQLKNGLVYSGKYEGGICAFECPHVIAFSNEKPKQEMWSHDRLKIKNIGPAEAYSEI